MERTLPPETSSLIRVLLVDDDEDEYVITRDLFDRLGKGYALSWAGGFEKGIEAITGAGHDVCLLDFRLGTRTGLEFLAESVSRNVAIPIIFLTGQADYQVDLAAMRAGASDFLDKGELSPRILERSIRYALERRKNEEKIRFLAYFDPLTDLPNRTLFYDRMKTAFASARRHDRRCGILFLDIDNFKRINDSLGHTRGDFLIREVGRRLLGCIRKEDAIAREAGSAMLDTVARLGGDEFTILLSEIREPENASVVAERIRQALLAPVVLDGRELTVTVSIGIAVYPADGEDIETVVKHADTAMYSAKAAGKNNFRYFDQAMNAAALERLSIEQEMRRGLQTDQFHLRYLPEVELATGRVTGVEALLVWRHPEKGVIPPERFLPVAEEIGVIFDMGARVFELLKRDLADWRSGGLPRVSVSFNVSPKQLARRGLLDAVTRLLAEAGLEPRRLTLELTEHGLSGNLDELRRLVDDLRRTGVRVALDDFGSGSSSFGLLRHLRFDGLKIDRTLVAQIHSRVSDATITAGLLAIGRSLGARVVASGIETAEQLACLKAQGCEWGQGSFFHKPLSAVDVAALLLKQ